MTPTVIIIPVLNEEDSIGLVLDAIPKPYRERVIVADNGSTDQTAVVAKNRGAEVVRASPRGYGSACLAGIQAAKAHTPQYYIFLDGDYSDYPEDLPKLMEKIESENLDLVIGSRNLGEAEEGALLPQARFGNWLATTLMALRFGYRFSDLGPFRVIRAEALHRIDMVDQNFGWTMEMQVKALKYKLKVGEVSVRYRKRVGVSKITGTIKGTFLAGYKILFTLAKYSLPTSANPPKDQKQKENPVLHEPENIGILRREEPSVATKDQVTQNQPR